ncbi:unnamed protein product, partial [Chrysoparadoxa australica]
MARELDTKVDIWALGLILYNIAYLRPPFQAESNLAVINAKVAFPSPNPYSNGLTEVIMRMLTHNPQERADAAEISACLAALLEGNSLPKRNAASASAAATTGASRKGKAEGTRLKGANREKERSKEREKIKASTPAAALNPNSVAARRLASRKTAATSEQLLFDTQEAAQPTVSSLSQQPQHMHGTHAPVSIGSNSAAAGTSADGWATFEAFTPTQGGGGNGEEGASGGTSNEFDLFGGTNAVEGATNAPLATQLQLQWSSNSLSSFTPTSASAPEPPSPSSHVLNLTQGGMESDSLAGHGPCPAPPSSPATIAHFDDSKRGISGTFQPPAPMTRSHSQPAPHTTAGSSSMESLATAPLGEVQTLTPARAQPSLPPQPQQHSSHQMQQQQQQQQQQQRHGAAISMMGEQPPMVQGQLPYGYMGGGPMAGAMGGMMQQGPYGGPGAFGGMGAMGAVGSMQQLQQHHQQN